MVLGYAPMGASCIILWVCLLTKCEISSSYCRAMTRFGIKSCEKNVIFNSDLKGQKPRMVDIGLVKWHLFKMNTKRALLPKVSFLYWSLSSIIKLYNLTKYCGILKRGSLPERRKRTAFVKIYTYLVKIRCGRMRW